MPTGSAMSVGPPEDKFSVDNPRLGAFIAEVRTIVARPPSPIEAVPARGDPFSRLLADRTWLPSAFRHPSPQSGMGGGISSWLVYRSADRSLTLMSLVVPPGSATPIHDHLSWGLVGLYDGTQEERVFRELGRSGDGHRQLELDRKSTRLNSSHGYISYAVFCLKKKKTKISQKVLHKTNPAHTP